MAQKTPPRSPHPFRSPQRSPVTKTKSVALDQTTTNRVTVERFLSVDQSPTGSKNKLVRRKSGGGLQDLSGNGSASETSSKSHHKSKGLLNDILNPIRSYARRKSQCSSSDLSSDESDGEKRAEIQPVNKFLNIDGDINARRGSYNSFFSMLAGSSKISKSVGNSRRGSVDSNDSFKRHKHKSKKSNKSQKRHDSIDMMKSKKLVSDLKDLKSRKAEYTRYNSDDNSPVRRSSIDILRDRNRKISESKSANQSPVTDRKESHKSRRFSGNDDRKSSLKDKDLKAKLSKRKSLGETLSLKIPVSSIRRNSIDAFSLRSLFSLSRKNSAEDLKGAGAQKSSKKDSSSGGALKAPGLSDTQRRHSHGGGGVDTSSDAHIYKPVQRARNRLESFGVSRLRDDARSRTPSIVVTNSSDDYSRTSRRSSGPSVVVSPPSGSSSSYHSGAENSDSEGSSGSMSHSSITSLDSEGSVSSAGSAHGYFQHHKPPPNRKLRPKQHKPFLGNRRHSSSSRASSTTSDDVFDSESSGSESDDEDPEDEAPKSAFWASLQAQPPPVEVAASSDDDYYNLYDQYIFEGRRNSGDVADRARNSSSGSQSSVYIRGSMAPDYVAGVFREARALPAADPKLLVLLNEEEESQILVKFFKLHHSYDLIPTSAKLVIFDTSLQVKKAFYALVHNGVRAAPLWDHKKQKFVGMLTITDFIRILQSFYHNHDTQMEQLEDHRLHMWRTILKDEDRPLISTTPEESLFDAIHSLIRHKIHRLPVIDEKTGNVLYIITHKRILKFLYLYIRELPKPHVLNKTIGELDLGTYTNIETATPDTLLIEALNKFVERRISALPIVDQDGKLIDIYAKFDVINLAAEGTYNKLDVTLRQANESRNEWFEGVLSCTKNETLKTVMDRIVNAEVHRLVVVDDEKRVIGIVSLSDILNELVLKPAEAKEASLKDVLQNTNVCDINKSDDGSGSNNDDGTTKQEQEEQVVTNASPTADLANQVISAAEQHQDPPSTTSPKKDTSPGDSEDEGRYSMDKSEEVDRSEDGGSEALLQS